MSRQLSTSTRSPASCDSTGGELRPIVADTTGQPRRSCSNAAKLATPSGIGRKVERGSSVQATGISAIEPPSAWIRRSNSTSKANPVVRHCASARETASAIEELEPALRVADARDQRAGHPAEHRAAEPSTQRLPAKRAPRTRRTATRRPLSRPVRAAPWWPTASRRAWPGRRRRSRRTATRCSASPRRTAAPLPGRAQPITSTGTRPDRSGDRPDHAARVVRAAVVDDDDPRLHGCSVEVADGRRDRRRQPLAPRCRRARRPRGRRPGVGSTSRRRAAARQRRSEGAMSCHAAARVP